MNKKRNLFTFGLFLLCVAIIRGILIEDFTLTDNVMLFCYFVGGWSLVISLGMKGAFFKRTPSKQEADRLERYWATTEPILQTFNLSSILLKEELLDAGVDSNQKAAFDASIVLGVLESINIGFFDEKISEEIVLGTLHAFLTETYELDPGLANKVIHRVSQTHRNSDSYVALRDHGHSIVRRVSAELKVPSDPNILKAIALGQIYEDSELVATFKSECE